MVSWLRSIWTTTYLLLIGPTTCTMRQFLGMWITVDSFLSVRGITFK